MMVSPLIFEGHQPPRIWSAGGRRRRRVLTWPYRAASAGKTLLRLRRNGRASRARAHWQGLLDGLRL